MSDSTLSLEHQIRHVLIRNAAATGFEIAAGAVLKQFEGNAMSRTTFNPVRPTRHASLAWHASSQDTAVQTKQQQAHYYAICPCESNKALFSRCLTSMASGGTGRLSLPLQLPLFMVSC